MCEQTDKLIFCTCETDETTDLETIDGYKWSLSRFLGSRTYAPGEPRIRGKIMMQTEDLGNQINREKIMVELNERNCFDFDYRPEEMDCLHISTTGERSKYAYFSLLFKDGKWQHGAHPAFSSISENISRGKIKKEGTNLPE